LNLACHARTYAGLAGRSGDGGAYGELLPACLTPCMLEQVGIGYGVRPEEG